MIQVQRKQRNTSTSGFLTVVLTPVINMKERNLHKTVYLSTVNDLISAVPLFPYFSQHCSCKRPVTIRCRTACSYSADMLIMFKLIYGLDFCKLG